MKRTTYSKKDSPKAIVSKVKEIDILLGQRGGSTHWKGNVLLRQIADLNAEAYDNADKRGKEHMVKNIDRHVASYGARFLREFMRKDDNGEIQVSWHQVGPASSRKKIKAQLVDASKRANGTYPCTKPLPCHRRSTNASITNPEGAAEEEKVKEKGEEECVSNYKQDSNAVRNGNGAHQSPVSTALVLPTVPMSHNMLNGSHYGDMVHVEQPMWVTEVSHYDVIIGANGASLQWHGNLHLRNVVTMMVAENLIADRPFPFNSTIMEITTAMDESNARFLQEFVETGKKGEIIVRWLLIPKAQVHETLLNACEVCLLHMAGHGPDIHKSLDRIGLFQNLPPPPPPNMMPQPKLPYILSAQPMSPQPMLPTQPYHSIGAPHPSGFPSPFMHPPRPVETTPAVVPASQVHVNTHYSHLSQCRTNGHEEAQLKYERPSEKSQPEKFPVSSPPRTAVEEEVSREDKRDSSSTTPAATKFSIAAAAAKYLVPAGESSPLDDLDVSSLGPMPTARQEELYQKTLRSLRQKEFQRPTAADKIEAKKKSEVSSQPAMRTTTITPSPGAKRRRLSVDPPSTAMRHEAMPAYTTATAYPTLGRAVPMGHAYPPHGLP